MLSMFLDFFKRKEVQQEAAAKESQQESKQSEFIATPPNLTKEHIDMLSTLKENKVFKEFLDVLILNAVRAGADIAVTADEAGSRHIIAKTFHTVNAYQELKRMIFKI